MLFGVSNTHIESSVNAIHKKAIGTSLIFVDSRVRRNDEDAYLRAILTGFCLSLVLS